MNNSTYNAEQNVSEEVEPPLTLKEYPSIDKAVKALSPLSRGHIYLHRNEYDHSISICISTRGKGGYEAARFYHREAMLVSNEDFVVKNGFSKEFEQIIKFFQERQLKKIYTPRKNANVKTPSRVISLIEYLSRSRKEDLKYEGESYNDVLDRKFQESLDEKQKLEESISELEEQVNEVVIASESQRLVS